MILIKYKGSRKKYNQKNLPNMEPIPFLIVWTAIVLMGGSSAEKLKYSVFALLKLCFRSAVFLTSVSLALIHESLTGSIWFEIMLTVAWYFSMIISLFVFSYFASVLSISLSWVDIVVVMLLGEQGFLSSKIYSIISSPKILWRSPLNSRRLALTLALAETISGVLHSQVDTWNKTVLKCEWIFLSFDAFGRRNGNPCTSCRDNPHVDSLRRRRALRKDIITTYRTLEHRIRAKYYICRTVRYSWLLKWYLARWKDIWLDIVPIVKDRLNINTTSVMQ